VRSESEGTEFDRNDLADFCVAAEAAAKAVVENDGKRAVAMLRRFRAVLESPETAEAAGETLADALRAHGLAADRVRSAVALLTACLTPQADDSPIVTEKRSGAAVSFANEHWQSFLLVDRDKPLGHFANVLTALRCAPQWQGVLRFDTFSLRHMISRPPPFASTRIVPRPVVDADIGLTLEWLQSHHINASFDTVSKAVDAIAQEHRYSPVADYLNGLAHDGAARIDTWLIDHFGVAEDPLSIQCGRKFLIGAVARVLSPGAKVDTMIILEGRQGLGKSKALRALFRDDWFCDHLPDLNSKDAVLQLRGRWCIEIAEMTTLSRADTNKVKGWLSIQSDYVRLPYGRLPVDLPRQTVFAGTLNPGGTGYLRDETGGRRFWPMACGATWGDDRTIDTGRLALLRDQLWAEAVLAYRAGDNWWLDHAAIEDIQAAAVADRYDDDPWTPNVVTALGNNAWVRPNDLFEALHIAVQDRSRAHQMRLGGIMRAQGWTRTRRRIDGSPEWVYVQPPYWEPPREQSERGAVAAADILPFSPRQRV
jgi:predicted P-loop ATPase